VGPEISKPILTARNQTLIVLALALGIGFLGAKRFAFEAGFSSGSHSFEIVDFVAGIILFLVAAGVLKLLLSLVYGLFAALAQTVHRPPAWIGLTLILCGTACVLFSLLLQFLFPGGSARVSAGYYGGGFSVDAGSPFTSTVLAYAALAVGVGMVALGVWSCIPATPPTTGRVVTPTPFEQHVTIPGERG
jgi:hypothetical protein